MIKLPAMATAAVVAVGSLGSTQAQAWDGRAVAAGAIGGLAAGAVIGSAVSNAYAGPYYGGPAYAYAPAYAYEPAYAYDYEPAVRTTRVVRRAYAPRHREVYASAYVPRRVVRSYVDEPGYYGPARYNWGGPVAVSYGYGPGWW